jgi:hypothetical protein
VTGTLIAPVIPSSAAARPARAPAAARTLPLTVPAEDTLTGYSPAVVDQALRALIPFPAREGGDR